MSQFFKFLFASCLGTILAVGFIFFLLFAVGASMSTIDTSVSSNSVLLLEFDGTIPEHTSNVEQDKFDFSGDKAIGVHRIKKLIKHAQNDKNIKGIVYKPSFASQAGMATNSILRKAIKEFKDSTDKFVYSYADYYTNPTYLIASASDSIFINPNGMLELNGYGAMIPFFKEGLEKLGVEMNVFYAGNFKSATEPYRRNDMSESNRLQTREYLTDNFNLYLDEVSESRNLDRSKILEIINTFNLNNITDGLENNLLDASLHWFEFEDILREKLNIKEGKKVGYIELGEYDSKTVIRRGTSKNKIALIYAEGEIIYGSNDKGIVSEEKYHKLFDKIRSDDNFKAVVLRVNSPGGSAFTSDVIWREMKALQAQGIPVVASYGDYAASGGYYISAGADRIIANPRTLTGSIGVFSMLPNASRLLDEKLGIHFDTVKTSPYANAITPFFDLGKDEKQALQNYTDEMYAKFLGIVAEGREKTVDEIHEVAQGRVWTGARALQLGLVDELGDLDDALEVAAQMAELEDYKVYEYPTIKKEIWEEFLEGFMAGQAKVKLTPAEKELYTQFKDLRAVLRYREPIARMQYTVIH